MASLAYKNGRGTIQHKDRDGRRRTVRLGATTKKTAQAIRLRVNYLEQAILSATSIDPATAEWVASIGDELHAKLVKNGLVAAREKRDASNLAAFLDAYFDRHTGKPRTRMKLETTRKALIEFFGASKRLEDVTEGDARDFRQTFKDRSLRENSIRKHVAIARQFFEDAKRRRIIQENPFAGLPGGTIAAPDRMAFVTHAMIQKVIDAEPCHEWKLIIALARYGGLRCPSEVLKLTWSDIDWERGRMTVPVPKLEHIPGKEYRVVPIFGELKPYLEGAFDLAPEGAVNVIGRYRDGQNLVPQFREKIRRSGQECWPKAFQNCRSSRQTELEAQFPSHTVCQWMGNSPKIAARHYLQVLDSDVERATRLSCTALHEALQNVPEQDGMNRNTDNNKNPLFPSVPSDSDERHSIQCTKVAVVGLEPTTYGL